MGSLERYSRRIARLEAQREAEHAPQIRDSALRRMRKLFDEFDADSLGMILVAEADRADGFEPETSDAYVRWQALGGPEVWEAIQRAIYSLAEQGKVPLESGFLRDLGIEGERGHVAMSYLERHAARLAELEEEGFVEQG